MPGPGDGRTWYVVMGVQPDASQDDIRASYLRLARTLHPDRHEGASETERQLADRRMREVNAAWTVLGDPSARARYDEELHPPAPPTPKPNPVRTSGARPESGARPTGPVAEEGPPYVTRRPEFLRGTRVAGDKTYVVVNEDDEMVELTKHETFFLRRVPVIIGIAIAIGIFIGSAYAGTHSSPPSGGSLRIPTTVACSEVKPGSDC